MKKILITGAGAPGGPGIIKALEKAGYCLHTSDCNPLASGRFLHHDFVQVPTAEDNAFIPAVLNYCIAHQIDVVFPLVTKELVPFSEAKDRFADNGVKVIISEPHSLNIANDKGKLYRHLVSTGIHVPLFRIATTAEELRNAAKELGYPRVPVCIKPTVSNGSRGVRILQEDIDDYSLLFHQKPNHLFSKLETICQILQQKPFPPILVSSYLPGPEVSVDTIVQEGVPKLILPRTREKMNGGISVQGTFVQDEKIVAYCDQILRSLNLSGPIGLQVKEDTNGVYQLLEINPRIQGTSVAALGAGINLPALAVEGAFGPIAVDMNSIAWGTSFVRYYEELFYTSSNI